MSHSEQTQNLELPIYGDTVDDKPTYLGDWNEAMNTIDTEVQKVRNDVLQQDNAVSNLTERVQRIETNVTQNTTDIATVKTDLATVKTDLATAKTDIANIKVETASIESKLTPSAVPVNWVASFVNASSRTKAEKCGGIVFVELELKPQQKTTGAQTIGQIADAANYPAEETHSLIYSADAGKIGFAVANADGSIQVNLLLDDGQTGTASGSLSYVAKQA